MPTYPVIEVVGSREANVSLENPSIELMFTATGTYDDSLIRAAIEAELPATWNLQSAFFGLMTLVIQSYRVRQKMEGGPNFDGTAMYGRRQPRKTGQLWFSFDGTGSTAHIQTSLETVNRYGRTEVAGAPTGVAGTNTGPGGTLVHNTTYKYCVTASGSTGESNASSSVNVTPITPNNTASITWNAVTGATSYTVYRTPDGGSFATPAKIGNTTGLSFADTGITPTAGSPPTTFTPQVVPDYERAIGVSGDSVEGCDKVIPNFKFRLDYYPATSLMTAEYIMALYNLVARPVNASVVTIGGLTFAPGELLYLGPTGQPRGFDDWELGLNFIASPNVTGINLGEIQGIAKAGHDYLWVQFMKATRENCGIMIPQFAFVERIYDRGNFSTLGIDGIPIEGVAGM